MSRSRLGAALAILAFLAAAMDPFDVIAQTTAPPNYPAPRDGTFIAKDFRFHTGEVMPELKLAYKTIGDPQGEPVLVLHGTAQSAQAMLNPVFAGQLFGEGQPLDARRYFIILPDALGNGASAKPSDGLKAKFPRFNYDDMVDAQYRLVTEGLGIRRLRLIIGNSMGGMHGWIWGTRYPALMDAIVPMASQPTEMSSRNWMMRRLVIEAIRNDPDYRDGEYSQQPKYWQIAYQLFATGTNGGTLAYQQQAPTRAAADKAVEARLAAPLTVDANNFLYQWAASGDYNPAPRLEAIKAHVLAINSADDERNPPETGLMVEAFKKVAHGRLLLIPASNETRGHATTAFAKFWARDLREFLAAVPKG